MLPPRPKHRADQPPSAQCPLDETQQNEQTLLPRVRGESGPIQNGIRERNDRPNGRSPPENAVPSNESRAWRREKWKVHQRRPPIPRESIDINMIEAERKRIGDERQSVALGAREHVERNDRDAPRRQRSKQEQTHRAAATRHARIAPLAPILRRRPRLPSEGPARRRVTSACGPYRRTAANIAFQYLRRKSVPRSLFDTTVAAHRSIRRAVMS